jgi:L-2,4-diaminobutyrate decarboxylase
MTEEMNLEEIQKRVEAVYHPDLFRQAGTDIVDLLASHLDKVQSAKGPVQNWKNPSENISIADDYLSQADQGEQNNLSTEQKVQKVKELAQQMLSSGQNLHHRYYLGHQVPASIPIAGLFDTIGAVTNQVMAIYEMGPWATAVETALITRLGKKIGWKENDFSGIVTHGGSLANLTCLLTARNVVLDSVWEKGIRTEENPPVIVVHSDAHYSISRSVGILGLGTDSIIKAELDDKHRIDPKKLDDLLADLKKKNQKVIAVCACACATPFGAFDPLEEIAEVCQKYNVWFHVDAAHGGSACFSQEYQHLVAGLHHADSVVWDAHKMMFVPALCAFAFLKNKDLRFETFQQDASYLYDPSNPGMAEYDSGLKTIECTKRAAAYGLWGTWSLFGSQIFADMVDVTFTMGKHFHDLLTEADDYVPLHEPQCNIVAFKHIPEALKNEDPKTVGDFQLELRKQIVQSGDCYIVPIRREGIGALRVTIINPLTKKDDLKTILQIIRDHAQKLLSK